MEIINKHRLSFVETFSENEEGESFLVAKELVNNLFFEMAKLCTKYSNETFCDLPYTYRERQLDSVLLPALSKICNSMVFAELPAKRECNNRRFHVEKSSGRLDYWCMYKDYSFVLELKHSYDCFTTPKTRERTITERWIKMNEQLDSLKKEIKQYEEKTKGVIRIGLHIMTSYSDKTPNNQLYLEFLNSIPLTFERLQKDLSKRFSSLKPNLMICWKIPKKIVFNDSEQTFPGVGGKIKDFGNRSAYSSFGDGGFKRFDGGIRVGCGLAWEMLYAELGYDFGLTNIGDDYFNDTHNGAFFANIGINF